jgi:hypothetical protein
VSGLQVGDANGETDIDLRMFEEGFKKELRASQKQRREQQVREVENKPCKGNCQDPEACRLAIYVFPTTCILSGTYMQFPPASLA